LDHTYMQKDRDQLTIPLYENKPLQRDRTLNLMKMMYPFVAMAIETVTILLNPGN